MIKGIGNDIVEVSRFEDIVSNNPRFIERFFTPSEAEYIKASSSIAQTLAGRFCAKEAVAKALGTGVRGYGLKEIEVCRDELGKPSILLHGRAKELAYEKGISVVQISISHSHTMATAFAIAE